MDFHDDLNKTRLHHHQPASQEHLRLRQLVQHVVRTRPTIREQVMDFFDRLGLPRRFSIDANELERAYLALAGRPPRLPSRGFDADLTASLELVGRCQRGL